MNILKTFILLTVMAALFTGTGFIIGGKIGMFIGLSIAIGIDTYIYLYSDKKILKMYNALPIEHTKQSHLYSIVQELAQKSNMPVPKLYIISTPQPNALAVGINPQNSSIAITVGLIDFLSDDELTGVIAHELASIKNHNVMLMTVITSLAGWIEAIVDITIVTELTSGVIEMIISRSCVYEADKIGAEICGNPLWLASALAKIDSAVHNEHIYNKQAENKPAIAPLFIINPLISTVGKMDNLLFPTHPSTRNRIDALEKLANQR